MSDQANAFLKDYQTFAQQSWNSWVQHLQQQSGVSMPSAGYASTSSTDDLLSRSLAGLSDYANWLQGAAHGVLNQGGFNPGSVHQGAVDGWQQQLQGFLGGFGQPFAQVFSGIDNTTAHGFAQQWQRWLQAAQQHGAMGGASAPMAPLGYTREQQLQQQAMAAAMGEYFQTNKRYNDLLQQVSAKGIARLQAKLAERVDPEHQLESVKALYDLWVDAMEEAYAETALSDEFRDAYGAMVNAQMQLRKLQRTQTEQLCRELGMPTRSEVDSLGKRLQELRRQWRGRSKDDSGASDATVADLEAEVARLKRQLAARETSAPSSVKTATPAVSSKRKKPVAATVTNVKAAQSSPRKRK